MYRPRIAHVITRISPHITRVSPAYRYAGDTRVIRGDTRAIMRAIRWRYMGLWRNTRVYAENAVYFSTRVIVTRARWLRGLR